MPLQLRYFYGGEADQFNFYRIPKALFTDRRFGKLSMEAKVLYGLLLDRMCLSTENGWFDGQGRVYIFFTLEDAMAMLGYGKDKLVRVFKELDVIGLIERKKQGLGRPTIIYVKNFVLPPEPAEPPAPDLEPQNPNPDKTSGKPKSGLPDAQTSEKPTLMILRGMILNVVILIYPSIPSPFPCRTGARDNLVRIGWIGWMGSKNRSNSTSSMTACCGSVLVTPKSSTAMLS